jgi:peptidoglycan/xylan/chitin deacetylase (PgdA/CDA1 family)
MPDTALKVAAATTTAALLAGAWTYAALWPQSQLFGKVLVAGPDPNQIALTYDDGPNPDVTERLLEVLARHNVRATFFMIGNFVRQRPDLARAVAAAGHLIGNHTMTHPWLAWQSAARIREELTGCNKALEDALGASIRYFRAPHGARRPYVLRTAAELGLIPVQWNVTAFDWNPIPPEKILQHLQQGIHRNRQRHRASNLLLHDGGHLSLGQPRIATVQATDQLLQLHKTTNTTFVTPEDWA